MDIGTFKHAHKQESDCVVFSDLQMLFKAFQELKNHVVSSRQDLDSNNGQDFLVRMIMGVGTALGFLAMLAVNS